MKFIFPYEEIGNSGIFPSDIAVWSWKGKMHKIIKIIKQHQMKNKLLTYSFFRVVIYLGIQTFLEPVLAIQTDFQIILLTELWQVKK